MYYFKKLSLINRKLRLIRKLGKLKLNEDKMSFTKYHNTVDSINAEIKAINEALEYLQKDSPQNTNKINNTSVNVGAKNDSGARIQLPPIK